MRNFEKKIEELENIMKKLEDEKTPLEEAINLYIKGISLIKELNSIITDIEAKVEIIKTKLGSNEINSIDVTKIFETQNLKTKSLEEKGNFDYNRNEKNQKESSKKEDLKKELKSEKDNSSEKKDEIDNLF